LRGRRIEVSAWRGSNGSAAFGLNLAPDLLGKYGISQRAQLPLSSCATARNMLQEVGRCFKRPTL
jgi:hypothetical protein